MQYIFSIRDNRDDPEWDNFLKSTLGNFHVQTSSWAELKYAYGQRVVRVIAKKDAKIVGGIQALIKAMSFGKKVAYVSKGPIYDSNDDKLGSYLITILHKHLVEKKIFCTIIHPPLNDKSLIKKLKALGYFLTPIELSPSATVLVDLQCDENEMLQRMKKNTRYNIRLSQRRGIAVREGEKKDLDDFYNILKSASSRKQFNISEFNYYETIWNLLHPKGIIKIFIAEYKQNIIAAQMVAAFGDTVVTKVRGWSGKEGRRKPNEALTWFTICWAKSHGYQYYDLGGIDCSTAIAVMNNEHKVKAKIDSVDIYKLGFGGDIIINPKAFMCINNRLCNVAVKILFQNKTSRRFILDLADLLRKN